MATRLNTKWFDAPQKSTVAYINSFQQGTHEVKTQYFMRHQTIISCWFDASSHIHILLVLLMLMPGCNITASFSEREPGWVILLSLLTVMPLYVNVQGDRLCKLSITLFAVIWSFTSMCSHVCF